MIRFLKRIFKLGLIIGLAGVGLIWFFLQDSPTLKSASPPTPEDVAQTRQLVRDLRAASNPDNDRGPELRTDEAQLNSAVRLGARFIPGFRGRVAVADREVLVEASVPVPWWPEKKWLNVTGRVPEFDQKVAFSQIVVGATEVPPAQALALARFGANLVMGDGFGNKVVQAASAMQIRDDTLVFRIALDDVGKNGVMRGAFGALRGQEMPAAEEIESYHRLVRAAMADGTLRQSGSFLPYLRFTLAAALDRSTPQTWRNAYTAAIFGLAKVCGAQDFAFIVGRIAFDEAIKTENWASSCNDVTFNGRIDSRRHFVTAAALKAASNTGVAVSIGEFKELYDSISGAGGFDFTDLAANQSGIRMSDFLMAAPYDELPAILARIERENDVIVPYDGIPQIMSQAEFEARYSNVDSSDYKAQFSSIDAKITELRLYQR